MQPFNVHRNFGLEFALDVNVMLDIFSYFGNIVFGEIFDSRVGIYARFL